MSRGKKAKRRDELLDHPRLKQCEIKEWRDKLRTDQFHNCPICGLVISENEAVLDHSHQSGLVRATLHRACNAMLGKIENGWRRMGMDEAQLYGLSPRVYEYINADYSENPYHPSHRTAEEKRLSRNQRAREKRVAKKPETKASKGYKNSPARRKKD